MGSRNRLAVRRRGFTLIEMLVVITLLTVLATLSVAIIPKIQERTKAAKAADQVQGWLLIAKQRALRDRAPRGIRLIIDTSDYYVRNLQYIEQPDPFTGGTLYFDINLQPNQARITGDLSGGFGTAPANKPYWPVQAFDYLQFQGGSSALIQDVSFDAMTNTFVVTTLTAMYNRSTPPSPNDLPGATQNYLITRAPRTVAGEDTLRLPDDVVVDMRTIPGVGYSFPDWTAATLTPSGLFYDILFSPSGALMGSLGDRNGKIILWFRDSTQDPDQPGDQPLIVIFSRTGRIGAFPYNPDPSVGGGDPYYYVLDPRATGL